MLPEIDQFLACSTPAAWVEAALERQDVMLLDHKACEMKAAATAVKYFLWQLRASLWQPLSPFTSLDVSGGEGCVFLAPTRCCQT